MWATIGSWLAIPWTWLIPTKVALQAWLDVNADKLWEMWMSEAMYSHVLPHIPGV